MEITNSWDKRDEHSDRNGFIRKVYGILSVQLLVTAGAITWVKTDPALNAQFMHLQGWAIGAIILATVIELMLICC